MSKKCFHCLRISVVVVNFILLLIGIALLGSAIFLYIRTTDFDISRSPDHYLQFKKIHSIIMGIGIFTIILATVGCFGAYHESHLTLSIYFIVMLLLFGNQIAAGSLYVVYRDETLATNLKLVIGNYNIEKSTVSQQIFLNTVQKMLKCCGVEGIDDYKRKDGNTKLPSSCCNYEKHKCSEDKTFTKSHAFAKGCSASYANFSEQKLRVIFMIMIVMCITEFLGLIFSISMCFAIRYSYNKRSATNNTSGYAPVTRNMIV